MNRVADNGYIIKIHGAFVSVESNHGYTQSSCADCYIHWAEGCYYESSQAEQARIVCNIIRYWITFISRAISDEMVEYK